MFDEAHKLAARYFGSKLEKTCGFRFGERLGAHAHHRREQEPVLKRHQRACFARDAIRLLDKPGSVRAMLMHSGHPLILAGADLILERHANLLRQGAILAHPTDGGAEPWLLFLLTHEVNSGDGRVLSKRLHFVRVGADDGAGFPGWAPHLDLEHPRRTTAICWTACSTRPGCVPTRSGAR